MVNWLLGFLFAPFFDLNTKTISRKRHISVFSKGGLINEDV